MGAHNMPSCLRKSERSPLLCLFTVHCDWHSLARTTHVSGKFFMVLKGFDPLKFSCTCFPSFCARRVQSMCLTHQQYLTRKEFDTNNIFWL